MSQDKPACPTAVCPALCDGDELSPLSFLAAFLLDPINFQEISMPHGSSSSLPVQLVSMPVSTTSRIQVRMKGREMAPTVRDKIL